MGGKRLEGVVALVTGGQKGIGEAICRAFGREGASVAVNYLDDAPAAQEIADAVEKGGGRAVTVQGDVCLPEDIERMIEAARALGPLGVMVNNAGIFPRAGILEIEEAEWDLVHDVNLKGTFRCAQAAAREMVDTGTPGSIINLSSIVAFTGGEQGAHYMASKAGVLGLTRAIALELAPHRIRVNAIAPGLTDTDQPRDGMSEDEIAAAGRRLPLGRIARPEEVADLALFLASGESRHVTGQTLHVNGGQYLT